MEPIAYLTLKDEIIAQIGRTPLAVLATACDNRVTARAMSIVNDGLTIYFQTGSESLKFSQILANPRVALCADNMQIEGLAEIVGHPLDHPFFVAAYSARHPGSFRRYSHLKTNALVSVIPTRIVLWKYNPDPYRDFLEIGQGAAYREAYGIE